MEKSTVPPFGHDVILCALLELGDDLSAGGTRDGMVAPQLELVVDALDVRIVAEDDSHTVFAGLAQELGRLRDDGKSPITLERPGDKRCV